MDVWLNYYVLLPTVILVTTLWTYMSLKSEQPQWAMYVKMNGLTVGLVLVLMYIMGQVNGVQNEVYMGPFPSYA